MWNILCQVLLVHQQVVLLHFLQFLQLYLVHPGNAHEFLRAAIDMSRVDPLNSLSFHWEFQLYVSHVLFQSDLLTWKWINPMNRLPVDVLPRDFFIALVVIQLWLGDFSPRGWYLQIWSVPWIPLLDKTRLREFFHWGWIRTFLHYSVRRHWDYVEGLVALIIVTFLSWVVLGATLVIEMF